ncbi:MAG: hypothetical protein IJT00_06325 [Lachnospiraceae bacterium]|nr:hypothetical protein [Lachnospiraceae bacterium]
MPDIAVYSLSGIYDGEGFYREHLSGGRAVFRDLTGLSSVNGYCSEGSLEQLSALIQKDRDTRIHFIDNGNYHYLSYLWMKTLMDNKHDGYGLIYLDNHDDTQEAAFGGLLSCGSWVRKAREDLNGLHNIKWIGPENYMQDLMFEGPDSSGLHKYPAFISVDKDILSEDEVRTNWDQGTMTLPELLDILDILINDPHISVCGIDVCGGPDRSAPDSDLIKDDEVNREILSFLDRKYLPLTRGRIAPVGTDAPGPV